MSEFIEMDVFGKKENILEMRIKGEIIPYWKNYEFLITDTLDGEIVLSITNKTTYESQKAIFDSEEFLKEIKEFLQLRENKRT